MKLYEKYMGLFLTDEQIERRYPGVKPQASREMVAGMVAGLAVSGVVAAGLIINHEIQENQHCEAVIDNPDATAKQLNDCY